VSVGALAASMPTGLTVFTFSSLFFGVLNFITALVSQYYGAQQYKNCSATLWQGFYIALFAYFILLLTIPLGFLYFRFLKMDARIFQYAKPYFTILMIGAIFMLLNNALSAFFAGIGNTKIVMYSNLTGMLLNIPLNYLLIFGLPRNSILNFQGAGIIGAAVASVIATMVTFYFFIKTFWSDEYIRQFDTRKNYKFNSEIFKKLFIYGGHSGIEFFLNILSFNVFIFLIGSIGIIEQAAVNITFSWNLITFLPLIGISIATTSLVGKNLGAQQIRKAEISIYSSLKISFLSVSIMTFFYLFFPELLVSVFTKSNNQEYLKISNLSAAMLRLITIYIYADVLLVIFSGALRGAGDTKFIMISSILAHWLLLTLPTFIAVEYLKFNAIQVWWIFIIFSILLSIIYLLRYLNGNWKNINLIEINTTSGFIETAPEIID